MSLVGLTNDERIWNFLKHHGLSDISCAAIMGNMYAESGLNSKNLQNSYEKILGYSDDSYTSAVDKGTYKNFVYDGAGYGIVQHTYWSRKEGLLNYAKETKRSIGDLEMQLEYVLKELDSHGILKELKTITSIQEASNVVLLKYEKPLDQSSSVQRKRVDYSKQYYDKFSNNSSSEIEKGEISMSNSPLVSYTKLSPCNSGKRNHVIDTISIHCMAGDLSVESCGNLFANRNTQASSNYGIGSDGRIALYVDEANRSWCTSSSANDNRAITIEVANTKAAEPYPISDKAYASLIDLLVDICKRNGIPELRWRADKNLIGQVDRQNMTVHRWFAAKSCPGTWLYEHHGQIAEDVNKRLKAGESQSIQSAPVQVEVQKEDDDMNLDTFKKMMQEYRAELQDNDASEWSRAARDWAMSTGLVQGGSAGEFNGMWQDFLTREQLTVILYRYAQMIGKA